MRRYAVNVQWNINFEEVTEKLNDLTPKKAAEALEIPEERYAAMHTNERLDYAYDFFRHAPGALDEFLGLPEKIEIPESLTKDEDISEWLSDEFGYCHGDFEIVTEN